MKSFLLKFPFVHTAVYWRDYCRNAFMQTFRKETAIRERFLRKCGYEPDLKDPKTYNEKLQWLKLNWYDPLAEKCADKVEVRAYVAEQGFADSLVPVVGVYTSVSQIKSADLPEKFVLKGTHGSGMVCLCTDRSAFDYKAAMAKCRRWLKVNFYFNTGEWVYKKLKKRVLCEQFLETEDGAPPCDYKIYCFHGEPKCVMVASGRMKGKLCMDFFTPEWERMPFTRHNPNSAVPPEKPAMLEEMLDMARALAKPFPHVRVDLYCVKGKLWFGELTFFPATGMQPFDPFEYDLLFGSWLDLNKVEKKNGR